MEKQNDIRSVKDDQNANGNCNVNSSFNFTVGAIVLVVTGILGYLFYNYLVK